MISETGTYSEPCGRCGEQADCSASEALINNRPRWDTECTCPACGKVWHAGGPGPSPSHVRRAIIEDNGISVLRVPDPDESTTTIMKVLRDFDRISLSEAKRAVETLRTNGRPGTLVEVTKLASHLKAEGIETVIENG